VRDSIYRILLVKTKAFDVDGCWTKHVNRLSLPENGDSAILRTCKQIEREATDILYGENSFRFFDAKRVHQDFIRHSGSLRMWKDVPTGAGIGTGNAAKIKKAIVGLPPDVIRSTQDHNGGNWFLDMLCKDLVGLQELEVTTKYESRRVLDEEWVEHVPRRRVFMTTAARLVKYHPTLRTAVWSRRSGGDLQSLNNWFSFTFSIEVKAIGFERRLEEASIIKQGFFGHSVESFDVLLDTAKLCSAVWSQDPLWSDVNNFTRAPAELSLAVNPSELAVWPGEVEYDPLQELSPEDQIIAVNNHTHGRTINGKYHQGCMINGVFVKGVWEGDNFLKKGGVPERLVRGVKIPPERLVEGHWETFGQVCWSPMGGGLFRAGSMDELARLSLRRRMLAKWSLHRRQVGWRPLCRRKVCRWRVPCRYFAGRRCLLEGKLDEEA
jgi:hypothetical protein